MYYFYLDTPRLHHPLNIGNKYLILLNNLILAFSLLGQFNWDRFVQSDLSITNKIY